MKKILILIIMCVGLAMAAEAQNFVHGKVTDRTLEPIPGVRVSSTKKNGPSDVTDLDGKFMLEDTKRPRRIQAEYAGFTTKRIGNTKYSPVLIKMQHEKAIRYQGEVSVGFATNGSMSGYRADNVKGIYNFSTYFFETVHGVRFGKYFYMGLGANIGMTQKTSYRGLIAGPLLDLKGYLPLKKDLSLYVSVDAGYSFIDLYKDSDYYRDRDNYWQNDYISGDNYYIANNTWTGGEKLFDYYYFDPFGAVYLAYGVGLNYRHLNFSFGLRQLTIIDQMKYHRDYSYSFNGYTHESHYYNVPEDRPRVTNLSFFVKVGVKF